MSCTEVYEYSSDMMTSSNWNIFRVTRPLCGEFTGHPHRDQWRGALMLSLICAQTNVWINNGDAGDSTHHSDHYDVTVKSNGYHCRWRFCKMSVQDSTHIISIIEQGLSQLEKTLRWRRPCSAIDRTLTQNLYAFFFCFFLFLLVFWIISGLWSSVFFQILHMTVYTWISTGWSQTFYRNIPIRCFSYMFGMQFRDDLQCVCVATNQYLLVIRTNCIFLRIIILTIFQISWFR